MLYIYLFFGGYMFKTGIKAIKEISDYWFYHSNGYNQSVVKKSMKSIEFIASQIHSGFNYNLNYRPGDFVWIEHGHNPKPELSFEHLGIIYMKQNHMYYVLPITTPKQHNHLHMDAYHKIDNPNGNKQFVLIKQQDFPFLNHDSVVKTSELKALSEKRLKNVIGHINLQDAKIKDIIDITHKFYFPTYDYKENVLQKENSLLKMQLFLSNLKNNYLVNSLDELESVLAIPIDYRYELLIIETIDNKSNTCKIKLQLEDAFHQQISREILYTLK